MTKANHSLLTSWVEVSAHSDFPIQNLPFGIFCTSSTPARVGVRIGDFVLDLAAVHALGYFADLGIDKAIFEQNALNPFMALGKSKTRQCREKIFSLLQTGSSMEKDAQKVLLPIEGVTMLLPVQIGDYTDFYSSLEHATNVGKMFRPDNPLLPNWKHIPIGYHGRASSIVVSGTDFHRPKGQMMPQGAEKPIFGASALMDFELEVAFIIGKETSMGKTISTQEAEDYIFGFVLFNDWSARDIQSWEYQPLGPFLGKNFASSISAWVVMLEALEPFRVDSPVQEPEVLPYLQYEGKHSFDIQLEVFIKPENSEENIVCRSNFKYMYWNIAQQLAHHTINGCNINVGDMMASGTISGQTPDSYGSMLELTWRGAKPLQLSDGSERKFLKDHDTVIVRGFCEKDGLRIGFGEVIGKVLPAK